MPELDYLPGLARARTYSREFASGDLSAALIVTVMLVPQSLAYAMLAGLPAEVGLYASIAPLVMYALLGTSSALAVGPVAVLSLMTGTSIASVHAVHGADPVVIAIALALLSGLMLLLMGVVRLGFVSNFLSHSVVAGFIAASGILIAAGQLRHILGLEGGGHNLPEIARHLLEDFPAVHLPTLVQGIVVLAFLLFARSKLVPLLSASGLSRHAAHMFARAAPAIAVLVSLLVSSHLDLASRGVAVAGNIPAGLPGIRIPGLDSGLLLALAPAAAMLALIGYVESISVARTFAAKRREPIDPNQELIALGGANIGSAISGGMPVTGGFSRSAVNFDAGARTPFAGAWAALGIAVLTLFFGPLLADLPKATLAATIIIAVLGIVDFGFLRESWHFARGDFLAGVTTIAVTLFIGVEAGIGAGVVVSILLHLYRTSKPHIAEVGRVPGTEHFRNIRRHKVQTAENVLSLRIDESLYFANTAWLQQWLLERIASLPQVREVIIQCSAVNDIDASALHALQSINAQLDDAGIRLHLSEVKGPVMDRLQRSSFLQDMSGQVFLSQYEAFTTLSDKGDIDE